MKFRLGNANGYNNVPSSSSVGSSNSRKNQKTEGAQIQSLATPASSNADTIMDLATPVPNANRSGGSLSKVVYRMEGIDEKKILSEEDEVERIVSGVTKGLRKSSRTKSSRANRPSKSTPNTKTTPESAAAATSAGKSSQKQHQQGVDTTKERSSNHRSSSSSNNNNKNNKSKSRLARKIASKKVAAVPAVSDDESSRHDHRHRQQKRSDQGLHGMLHHMMFDESVESAFSSNADDDVDCDYNYIDDESYGNTSSSSSSSGSSYSSNSSDSSASERRGIRHERNFGDDTVNDSVDVDDSVTASLSIDIESSFDTERSGSLDDSRALHDLNEIESKDGENESEDDENEREAFRYNHPRGSSPPPQGLDIVARLLSGAKEITLDASSITNKSGSSGKNTPVHEVARHVSDALAQTTCLQKLSFCGSWKGESSKARLVLEILFDGLLENTSVHTIILRDNFAFDRYAGYAFGTLLKAHSHGRLQTLEILHCKFVGSGWNSLLLGLQHSSSIKKLYVEDCNNLSSEDIDGITSTIQYLNIESLRLRKVKLHKVHIENLSFLLRAIQQTKTLKEVDLSGNNLGGAPRAILLLSKCLSGDPVWIRGSSGVDSDDDRLPSNYQHHIEKLILYDCGISEKSSIRTLAMALDSTLTKLDVNNNEQRLVLHTLDMSQNQFGNSGARILEKLLEGNPLITTLGMVGCGVGASHLKTVSDRLRYNNSFLQKIGLSSGVSLAILDSVSAVEHVFAGGARKAVSGAGVGGAGTTNVAMDGEDSDIEESARCAGCGTC
jgi:hypothetical protein